MANILVNFLFSGNSGPLVNAAGQASGALARFSGRLLGVSTSTLASAAGLAGLVVALKSVLTATIETSAEFQRLGTSFVSILAGPLLEAQKGAALTEQQLTGLRNASVALFREAQLAAIDTVATTKEYVGLLQAALAVGQNVGLSTEQTLIITKRLALAAGAFGIDFEKASTAIAQILSGSVRVTNQLGRNLGLATAEQRKALQASIAQGKLFDFLDKKTRNYAATAKEVANNFLNVKAAVFDIFQIGGTEAIKPLFNFLTEELIRFRDTFIGGKGQFFTPALQQVVGGIQQFFKDILPSLRVLFNELGLLLGDLGSKTGTASTVFKIILATITEIVRLLREAVNLEGVGGLIAGAFLFRTALAAIVPILEKIVYGFLNLRNNIILVNSATTALGQKSAAIGIVSAFGKATAITAIVVGLALAFKDLFTNVEDTGAALERVDKQLDGFRDKIEFFVQSADLTSLIADYQKLGAQQEKTREELERFAQIQGILKTVFDDTGLAAVKAGKLSAEAFVNAQKGLLQQLEARRKELDQLKAALASAAQGEPTSTAGELSAEDAALQEELNKKFQEQQLVLKNLALKYIPDYDAKLLENKDTITKYSREVETQLDRITKQIESQGLLTKSFDDLVKIIVEANAAGKDNYEASQKAAAAHAAIYVNLLREADGNKQVAAAHATAEIADTKRTITSLENSRARILAEEQYRITVDETTNAIIVNTALASDIVDIDEKIALARAKIAELLAARAEFSARPKPTAAKASKGGKRDELKDLLSELQRQLSLLKQVGDGIEKEAERFVAFRSRLLQQLGEAGSIPFQIALDAEEGLVRSQLELDEKLITDRLEFITQAQGDVAKLVAEQQRGKARGTTNKFQGQITAKEAEIKAAQQEVENLNKSRLEGENRLFEIGQKGAAFRIKNLQEELKLTEQLAVEDQKSQAALLEQAAGAGFASPEEALKAQFDADKAARDQRKREIERSIYPWLDPALSGRALTALKEIQGLVSKEANTAAFAALNTAADNAKALGARFIELDKARNEALRAKKPTEKLDTEIEKTSLALEESVLQVLELSKGLHLSADESKRFGEALAFALARGVTDETKRKGLEETEKLKRDQLKDERDNALKELKLAEDRLGLEGKFLDFSASQLDIRQRILETERELSAITELEYRRQGAALVQQRILLLENQKALKEAQLRAVDTKIAASGGIERAAPGLIENRLELQAQLNAIGQQFFELQNRAFDLTSPLIAVRDAFHQIADAVGALPEPFNKLKSVFSGLEHLIDILTRKQRPQAPEVVLTEASVTFNKSTTTFAEAVQKFAALVGVPGQAPGGTLPGAPNLDPTGRESRKKLEGEAKKLKLKINEKVGAYIRAVGTIASELLAGIASGDKGQIVSSIGASLQAIPDPSGITQAIGAGVEIIGGFVSFFGASAKKKTHEMAVAISDGIDELKHAISTGAIGLGQGIRELQAKLEDARRQLSGKKGGADELKSIEKDINAEIQRLRAEAKRIQDDFHDQLDLLRSPIELRDLITKINGLGDAAKKFLQSFETAEEAQKALGEAQEFVRRSIQELEDEIKKSLSSLQDDLKSATDKFLSDQRSILLEGRIDPAVSIAQSKRQRLVELSQQFNKERESLEAQIKGEQTKLDYVKSRERLEEKIARWTRVGADALSGAADKLTNAADALQRTFSTIGSFPFSGGGAQPVGGNLGTLNITVNGQPAGSLQLGISAVKHLELAGQISPSRSFGFNPV